MTPRRQEFFEALGTARRLLRSGAELSTRDRDAIAEILDCYEGAVLHFDELVKRISNARADASSR